MGALFGNVFGKDDDGNYKIKSSEWPKSVILSGSSKLEFMNGDKVYFEVTTIGENDDLSRNYGLNYKSSDPNSARQKPANKDFKSIDMVLFDYRYGKFLVVGNWNNPNFIEFCEFGKISERNYILSSSRERLVTADNLAEILGIDRKLIYVEKYEGRCSNCSLDSVGEVPGHPDRMAVERAIRKHLSAVHKHL